MIIDGHAHACGRNLTAEGVVETLDRSGADKVVLVPGEPGSGRTYSLPRLGEWFPSRDLISVTNLLTKFTASLTGMAGKLPEGNTYVSSLARSCPERILQFYWVYPLAPDAAEEAEDRFREWRFKGIKLHQCWESFCVDSVEFNRIAAWAGQHDLPVFIHLCSRREVLALIEYIEEHPNVKFIIAHLFGLESYIRSGIRSKNVYFDISPPPLISLERLHTALEHFGPKRIVLGSDTPYGKDNLRENIERVRNLTLSEEEKQRILGGNLQELLKL